MIETIDGYYSRMFSREKYNCLHFTREVWNDATGEDLGERLKSLFAGIAARRVSRKHARAFKKLAVPTDPCLVLMQRKNSDPHVGIFIRGSVLHLTEIGVEYQPVNVASRGFTSVRFYK